MRLQTLRYMRGIGCFNWAERNATFSFVREARNDASYERLLSQIDNKVFCLRLPNVNYCGKYVQIVLVLWLNEIPSQCLAQTGTIYSRKLIFSLTTQMKIILNYCSLNAVHFSELQFCVCSVARQAATMPSSQPLCNETDLPQNCFDAIAAVSRYTSNLIKSWRLISKLTQIYGPRITLCGLYFLWSRSRWIVIQKYDSQLHPLSSDIGRKLFFWYLSLDNGTDLVLNRT